MKIFIQNLKNIPAQCW